MRKFLTNVAKFTLVGLIPILLLLVLYIISDPFQVIGSYNSYYNTDKAGRIATNKDYISTSTYVKNSEKTDYNSFILGNSRSIFYPVSEWKKHLPQNSKCYHFDASAESLWALNKKIEFLHNRNDKIDNVLMVIDYRLLKQDKPKTSHIFITSPMLLNNSNLTKFQSTFFLAFISNPTFMYAYFDFKISDKVKPYMIEKRLIDTRPISYDPETNEIRYDYFEELIKKNEYYTPKRTSVFYKRDTSIQKYAEKAIKDSHKSILLDMQQVFKEHNTNVKIAISPLYDQLKLNKEDLIFLEEVFGKNNVHDFSGINEITNDYRNYYESSHYRKNIATQIMDTLYDNKHNW